MNPQFIRNLGVIAHIDAGKTTTTERILYYTGETHKMGEVHDGNTVTDHMLQERERGITITAAAISCAWTAHQGARAGQRHTINLIDTPGHVDFTAGVERSLRVLDGAVVVFCAVAGVQPQSETVWRQANKYRVPRVAFINKMDRTGANFTRVVEQVRERLGANAHPLYLPIGNDEGFVGLIDVVHQRSLRFGSNESDPRGLRPTWEPIPKSHVDAAKRSLEELIEKLAEVDSALAESYVHNQAIAATDLQAAIRRATIAMTFVGVIPGSAFKEKGVQRVLDAVVDYLSSPLDRSTTARDEDQESHALSIDPAAPLVALSFKLTSTPNGMLTFVRVYQGTLRPSQSVYNPRTRRHERVTRLVRMHAAAQVNIPKAEAGDICAVLGLKEAVTGDTLSSDLNLFLTPPTFPNPVLSLAIEPCSTEDQERMGFALRRLVAEDPTWRTFTDPETGQTLISGMGELHLDILRDRMKEEFRVNTQAGKPRLAYRATISRSSRAEGEYKHQSGGQGQYGYVVVEIEPNPGQGNEVLNEIVGGAIPREFIRATFQGIEAALADGVIDHHPVTDVRCRVVDGAFHPVDSSEPAFRAAARMAFKNAMREAAPLLLEPVMSVEVTTPVEHQGDILGDLSRRQGRIKEVKLEGTYCLIDADVPLQHLFGYVMDIRSLSRGRASCSMEPSHYAPLPAIFAGSTGVSNTR